MFIGQNKILFLVKIILKLAEMNFYLLRTASVRNSDFRHTLLLFVFIFYDTLSNTLSSGASELVRFFQQPSASHCERVDY